MSQLAAVKSGAAQMFGVNLGSWLVLEQYMRPGLYSMVNGTVNGTVYGERQLMQVRVAGLASRTPRLVPLLTIFHGACVLDECHRTT